MPHLEKVKTHIKQQSDRHNTAKQTQSQPLSIIAKLLLLPPIIVTVVLFWFAGQWLHNHSGPYASIKIAATEAAPTALQTLIHNGVTHLRFANRHQQCWVVAKTLALQTSHYPCIADIRMHYQHNHWHVVVKQYDGDHYPYCDDDCPKGINAPELEDYYFRRMKHALIAFAAYSTQHLHPKIQPNYHNHMKTTEQETP